MTYLFVTVPVATGEPSPKSQEYWIPVPEMSQVPLSRIDFPVYGSGLWSTLYGFFALDRDLRTVRGFTVYEHGETPGLGGEVENPK